MREFRSGWRHRQLLLLLLLLPTFCRSASVAVHDAEISVKSVRSIVYHDTQISLFKSDDHPDRLFHQPLSFLDTKSLRILPDVEMNRTRLFLDICLWTEEFLKVAEAKFPRAESIELMPLTHLQLTWSKQVTHWLGEKFNESYRLVGDWHDGDKPQMRTTFAIECLKGRVSCQQLQSRLNVTDGTAPQVLDLRYRVRGDRSEHLPVLVFARHILGTSTYREHLWPVTSKKVLVNEAMVTNLVEESLALVAQNFSVSRQELLSSDVRELNQSLTRKLFHYFHRTRVSKPFRADHWDQLAWPRDTRVLLPNKLAVLFNKLFVACQKPNTVRLNGEEALLSELKESMPPQFSRAIVHFMKHSAAPSSDINVEAVTSLASRELHSSLKWNNVDKKFLPGSFDDGGEYYSIDKSGIEKDGVIVAANLTIRRSFSEHSDHVRPMHLRQPSQMTSVWQEKFADSFCVLVKAVDPPRMRCDTIGFKIPERSLKIYPNLFNSYVDFQGGNVGQMSFSKVDTDTFSLSMRICCTKT